MDFLHQWSASGLCLQVKPPAASPLLFHLHNYSSFALQTKEGGFFIYSDLTVKHFTRENLWGTKGGAIQTMSINSLQSRNNIVSLLIRISVTGKRDIRNEVFWIHLDVLNSDTSCSGAVGIVIVFLQPPHFFYLLLSRSNAAKGGREGRSKESKANKQKIGEEIVKTSVFTLYRWQPRGDFGFIYLSVHLNFCLSCLFTSLRIFKFCKKLSGKLRFALNCIFTSCINKRESGDYSHSTFSGSVSQLHKYLSNILFSIFFAYLPNLMRRPL